eukprot:188979_1
MTTPLIQNNRAVATTDITPLLKSLISTRHRLCVGVCSAAILLSVIVVLLYYSPVNHELFPTNKLETLSPHIPSNEERSLYDEKVISIQYDAQHLSQHLSSLLNNNDEMNFEFHQALIAEYGYDSTKQNIQFVVFDSQQDGEYTIYANVKKNKKKKKRKNTISNPTDSPSNNPTTRPTNSPSNKPTINPTIPTDSPSNYPTTKPTRRPTRPTDSPSNEPTINPTNSPTFSPTQSPTLSPTNSPTNTPKSMECATVYTEGFQEGYMAISCSHQSGMDNTWKIVGCIAYEPYTKGIRWGEIGYYDTDCYTISKQWARITARCCRIRPNYAYPETVEPTVLSTSYSNYQISENTIESCVTAGKQCLVTGCTASDSKAITQQFSGVKYEIENFQSICKAQRSDAGYLWVSPYCASLNNGRELECVTKEGVAVKKVPDTQGFLFSSSSQCPKGYSMTDCNAYVDDEIDSCHNTSIGTDYGTNYGGFIEDDGSGSVKCIARGDSSSIVAQSVCCKIINN